MAGVVGDAGNPLSDEEREAISKYLQNPLQLPQEFKEWLPDWLGTNLPPIPVGQLLGYRGTRARYNAVATFDSETGPESTWTDLSTPGPEIAEIADGTYWAAWGYHCRGTHAGGATTRMGLSVNGADPSTYCETVTVDSGKSIWRAASLNVRGGNDNNTVTAKYWFSLGGGAEGQFERRWMILLRIT